MRKADNLPPSCAVVTKSENLNFLEPSGPVQACNGNDLTFFTHFGPLYKSMPIIRSARLYLCYCRIWCVMPSLLVVGGQVQGSRLCVRVEGYCSTHPGRIACCPAPDRRPPTTKALHTICGNNTNMVSSSWWWAYKCPKHVEQIISTMWIQIQQMQQYADIYLLQSYSTCFGCHSTHHQEY